MEIDLDDGELQRDSHMRTNLFNKQVVTIGGGTGPFAVLSSLKRYQCGITAIVTMSDSGGSSRRLMDEFGQLPFGDLRQALVALSRNGALWRDVFTFRFQPGHGMPQVGEEDPEPEGVPGTLRSAEDDFGKLRRVAEAAGVTGHSLGNLIISALQEINGGNLLWAIRDAQRLLGTAGDVLASDARTRNPVRRTRGRVDHLWRDGYRYTWGEGSWRPACDSSRLSSGSDRAM